jgi:hypothetical protein
MHGVPHTLEVRNDLWPEGSGIVPPDLAEGAYWRDLHGRPFALPELLAGADESSRDVLRARHISAISTLLAASLEADQEGTAEARRIRHQARRLIGEMDGWWVEQAREARQREGS